VNRHALEYGIVLFQLDAVGGVPLVLGGDVAGCSGLTRGFVLGTLQDNLYAVAFLCHDSNGK